MKQQVSTLPQHGRAHIENRPIPNSGHSYQKGNPLLIAEQRYKLREKEPVKNPMTLSNSQTDPHGIQTLQVFYPAPIHLVSSAEQYKPYYADVSEKSSKFQKNHSFFSKSLIEKILQSTLDKKNLKKVKPTSKIPKENNFDLKNLLKDLEENIPILTKDLIGPEEVMWLLITKWILDFLGIGFEIHRIRKMIDSDFEKRKLNGKYLVYLDGIEIYPNDNEKYAKVILEVSKEEMEKLEQDWGSKKGGFEITITTSDSSGNEDLQANYYGFNSQNADIAVPTEYFPTTNIWQNFGPYEI